MAAKDRIMRPCVCLALEANKIAVEREPLHTDLRLRVPHNNVTWDVWATLIRPAKPHPHLPAPRRAVIPDHPPPGPVCSRDRCGVERPTQR